MQLPLQNHHKHLAGLALLNKELYRTLTLMNFLFTEGGAQNYGLEDIDGTLVTLKSMAKLLFSMG